MVLSGQGKPPSKKALELEVDLEEHYSVTLDMRNSSWEWEPAVVEALSWQDLIKEAEALVPLVHPNFGTLLCDNLRT
eukprot:12886064-Prorocentrum_lima.AAC.1